MFGAAIGLFMAILASLYSLFVYATSGADAFEGVGTSVGGAISMYLVGGVVGGALGGFLLPLATWRIGAAIVGVFAAIPLYVGIALMTGAALQAGIVPACVVGALVGYGVWTPPGKGGA